jgi:hypothetical protein
MYCYLHPIKIVPDQLIQSIVIHIFAIDFTDKKDYLHSNFMCYYLFLRVTWNTPD